MTETRFDITVHDARPTVHESADLIWIQASARSEAFMPHGVTLFLADAATARLMGEALMRAAHRLEQIRKVRAEPVDVPTLADA